MSEPLTPDEEAARAYFAGMERARVRRHAIQARLMERHEQGLPCDTEAIMELHLEHDAREADADG